MSVWRVLAASRIHPIFRDLVESHGIRVDVDTSIDEDRLAELAPLYDAIVVRSNVRVTRRAIENGAKGRLKLIVRAGIGLDNIDVDAAREHGVEVRNTPEAPVNSVAELTLGLIIAAARRIVELNNMARQGYWRKEYGLEIHGKNALIIGVGRIGSRVATLLKALGVNVLGYDKPEILEARRGLVESVASLCEGLSRADIVSIHVPLTEETRGMIGRRELLECLKPGAILVNTSRGGVVDEEALLEALEDGRLYAAALDVLENEPPQGPVEERLLEHPRVIVTPHIGSQTPEAQERIAREAARIIIEKASPEMRVSMA
ncbi:MAG: hydroxyacid dehydrogenase [Desulfurococcales archaeon]|nr:hydroxyacid dehydrogenase [Desulfurococcales archaeon]